MKRKPLTEVLQAAQAQGATHMYDIGLSIIRVYRERGNRWQGRSIDVDTNGCFLLGKWSYLPGDLPKGAQYIDNTIERG